MDTNKQTDKPKLYIDKLVLKNWTMNNEHALRPYQYSHDFFCTSIQKVGAFIVFKGLYE